MKKLTLALSAAAFLFSSAPGFAQMTQAQKDECLLASKNCVSQVDDIYKRMHKLHKEIKKGDRVYSAEELKTLQRKLKETQDMLDTIERGGN